MSFLSYVGGMVSGVLNSLEYYAAEASTTLAGHFLSMHQKHHGEEKGWEQLTDAIENNNSKAVHLFLKSGVSINTPDQKGNTPLHLVNNVKDAKALINAGASVNVKNNAGDIPLVTAMRSHKDDVAKFFATNTDSNGNTQLHLTKNPYIVSVLVKAGADVNAENNAGETPLMKVIDSLFETPIEVTRIDCGQYIPSGAILVHFFASSILIKAGAKIEPVITHIIESEKPSDNDKQVMISMLSDFYQEYSNKNLNQKDTFANEFWKPTNDEFLDKLEYYKTELNQLSDELVAQQHQSADMVADHI